MRYLKLLIIVLLASGVLTACASDAPQVAAPPSPTATPAPSFSLSEADLARGRQVWLDKQCVACHGDQGQGGIGPTLTGITMPFDQFLHVQRTAIPPKPAFNAAELPDQDAYNVYAWLQSLETADSTAQAAAPQLTEGEILGMTLWTQYECDQCHGAFAQGSADAPRLANISYPYEMERATMRQSEGDIPQHSAEHIRDVILKRLYKWLQEGANPQGGC